MTAPHRGARVGALDLNSDLLAAVIESAPTAMVMTDAQGIMMLVNKEAEQLFGYPRVEMIGEAVDMLVPKRFRSHHHRLRSGYLVNAQARRMGMGRELFAARKDGVEVPVEIGLNPIQTDRGTLVLSAIVDISERLRLEAASKANQLLEERVRQRTIELEQQTERLQLSNQALERSNIELQQFAFVASHDLQSPLRTISSFVQLLDRRYSDQLDEQGQRWIRSATEATQRLSILIRDLLELSRVDSRAQSFRPVKLDEVVDSAIELLSDSLKDSKARIERSSLPEVSGDRSQLVQLFQNLVSNAVKYCGDAPPWIHIHAERHGGEWEISVEDRGIGIDADHLDRVFEIFRRLHSQKAYPGTGIGLAVCRRVATRHGGRIWVESTPGKGSTFKIRLLATDEGESAV